MHRNASSTFGALLLQHRLAAGLSQEELAERAGLSQRGISDLERGARRSPHPATARRLADALGLDSTARATMLESAQAATQPRARGHSTILDVPAAGAGRRDNLPAELSTFIGREQTLAQLQQRLAETRLLTIAGPGGVGKTRIALQLARTLQSTGSVVWLVELGPLSDDHLLLQTVAHTLGVRELTREPLMELVSENLNTSGAVLVLDNCEHLAHACAELIEQLLGRCPGLRIVATSRESLRIPGELLSTIAPMRLAPPSATAVELKQYESAQLFVERAAKRSPDFTLTMRNAAAIGRICRRLDGLPLAIELAAARVNVLSPEQIESRLGDCLGLLSGGRTTAPRQQTLSATFDWSYALLSDHQRIVFERISVFAGQFDLEAAEAVCGSQPVEGTRVLEHLAELVDKSLVEAERDATDGQEVRYRMLQTVRQYAYERLVARGEVDSARQRQAEWHAHIMDLALRELRADGGPAGRRAGQAVWLARLERDHDNLRGVLSWSIAQRQTELALRLGAGLARFWLYHAHLSEGRAWLSRILTLAGDSHPPHEDATPYMDCLFSSGMLASQQGDIATAKQVFRTILQLTNGPRARLVRGGAHTQLGIVAVIEGDLDGARAMYQQAIDILGQENEWMLSHAVAGLAQVSLRQGDSPEARRLGEQSLAIYRNLGDERQTAEALYFLAGIDIAQHQLDDAEARIRDGLAISQLLADPIGLITGLVRSGALALARHRPRQALRLFGAASAYGDVGELGFFRRRLALDSYIQAACAALDTTRARAEFADGQVLTLQQAVDEALGSERSSDLQTDRRPTPRSRGPAPATRQQ